MTIEVKNSIKPVDYAESLYTLENRVNDVLLGKKKELLLILYTLYLFYNSPILLWAHQGGYMLTLI